MLTGIIALDDGFTFAVGCIVTGLCAVAVGIMVLATYRERRAEGVR